MVDPVRLAMIESVFPRLDGRPTLCTCFVDIPVILSDMMGFQSSQSGPPPNNLFPFVAHTTITNRNALDDVSALITSNLIFTILFLGDSEFAISSQPRYSVRSSPWVTFPFCDPFCEDKVVKCFNDCVKRAFEYDQTGVFK